jgi:phage terminase Nu1 subunit (DNA packaging protein)
MFVFPYVDAMDDTVSSTELQQLLQVNSGMLATLARDGTVQRAKARGWYLLGPSVQGYVKKLREDAYGRGDSKAREARTDLGRAQAKLAQLKADQLAGRLVEAAEVEKTWTLKLRALRGRVLSIGDRLHHLATRDHALLVRELRAALTELAEHT